MNYFDLHCDTVTRCFDNQAELYKNNYHVSIERTMDYEEFSQVFAIFIDDILSEQESMEYFQKVLNFYNFQLMSNEIQMEHVLSKDDFESDKHCKSILSVENGKLVAGDLDNIDYLYNCGVRLLTLTWNGSNSIGNGAMSANEDGLTSFGTFAVKRMNELGMIIDVSHLNDKGFFDVASLSNMPIVASHSNCRAVCNHPRNLTDEQIKIICRSKGLIGLNLCTKFLADTDEITPTNLQRHIFHILELGGEDSLSFGADFDGTDVPDFLNGVQRIRTLPMMMKKWGIDETLCEKILYKNALNYFTKNL